MAECLKSRAAGWAFPVTATYLREQLAVRRTALSQLWQVLGFYPTAARLFPSHEIQNG
jgi:hypothetical protein